MEEAPAAEALVGRVARSRVRVILGCIYTEHGVFIEFDTTEWKVPSSQRDCNDAGRAD